ncbi:MAG: indolepyruvate ferredoxin oxidoreductase subunit alpha [Chloroflexi bacterium]|nr:indolepyruvate ferredoxin oxidoreductase subunit alpha [Chloroflexota bacterium]
MRKLLSGNEAIARGAWEYGVAVASAYPGTPSTEILEEFARYPNVYAEWATNEKVALDVAIGAAYAGRRAMSTMKHVGLNVAADAFFYASMTGIEGGLVIVSADDPSMHSSQNEQDNRNFGKFARVPVVEPVDSQEAKDLVGAALDISERFDTPVMLRITTRIAHSSTPVELGERREGPPPLPTYPRKFEKYVMLPVNARKRHPVIEERIRKLTEFAETFPFNRIEWGDRSLGIVTCGVAYQYAKEIFPTASILKLGMTYPIPPKMVREFVGQVERAIVLEELDPFVENEIKLLGIWVEGKSIFSGIGEMDPRTVREQAVAAGLLPESVRKTYIVPDVGSLPGRPPVLCPGCPHRGFYVITRKLKLPINGDIGCYTLGALPPLNSTDTCGCMGASIGVAHGADKAGSPERNIAVLGDSTFFHTGMPALLNVAYNKGKAITVVLDNRVTAMTGHQDNPGTGRTLQGQETKEIEFEPLLRALGMDHVQTLDAFDLREVERALREALKRDEASALVVRGECALLPEARKRYVPLRVDEERCNGCGLCFRVGCPAIVKRPDGKASIDALLCTGCEVCAQVCGRKAILFRAQVLEQSEA